MSDKIAERVPTLSDSDLGMVIKGLIIELTLRKSRLLFARHARRYEAGIQCLSGFPGQAGE